MSASAGLAIIIESPCCRHDAARSTGGQHLGQGLVIQLGIHPYEPRTSYFARFHRER